MDLNKLLSPRAMAVVGASEKEGFGGDTCRNILSYANLDHVYFVNPGRDEVFGQKCYKSLSELPETIDMVVVSTPQRIVPMVLKEAWEKGARGAVVFASGYSEVGTDEGRAAEKELKELCKELDMALMGPNCAGFVNYIENTHAFAFISEERDRKGGVGVVSQSGQLCLSLMDSPNMKFSYAISAGNASIVSMEDYLHFLVDDDNTKVVGLYLEGVTQPNRFIEALKKAALKRKPVVVLKAGSSEKGSQVAASHTGSLSGADRMYDAIFKKFGVIRVNDMEELLATTQIFSTLPELPKQPTFASINLSGGETGMCADLGEAFEIPYPDFAPETVARLRELLPSYASPANPLDTTATISYDADVYADTLQAVMDDPKVGLVIIGYTLLMEIADPCIHYMTEGIEKVVAKGRTKPMVMLPFLENTRNPEYRERLEKLGVPVLPPPVYGFAALKYLKEYLEYDPAAHTLEIAVPQTACLDGAKTLSEFDSMQLCRKYGITVPEGDVAATADTAAATAERVGYPVVLKVASADIPHKSDMGGVKLHLNDADAVKKAFAEIMANAKEKAPTATVDGVFVQHMLEPGLEAIIGVNNDPQFGPAVLCGLGGVFVEIFKDTALLPAPFGKTEAEAMVRELKALPLFEGYRGNAPLDIEALATTIARVAELAADNKETIRELDINPVFIYEQGKGVCAADALVVKA